jgi:hypothetical protein
MTPQPTPTRLLREYQRLYAPPPDVPVHGPGGGVRALVLELLQPAPWQTLAAAWQGVQADLDLPAPGIAVNGVDGLQLWFSLLEPVAPEQGLAFLERLRQRYLAGLPPSRVRTLAAVSEAPAPAPPEGPWPAFVAPDLAPLFEDTPWLDMRPGDDGQADLLSRLASIQPEAWLDAGRRLQPRPVERPVPEEAQPAGPRAAGPAHPQAVEFLLSVMNDAGAPLALRVEAAKALLPYGPA